MCIRDRVRYALFQTDKPEIFIMLASELMLLYGIVIVCWLVLRASSTRTEYPPEPMITKISATGIHMVVMAACMVFLAQSCLLYTSDIPKLTNP